MGHLEAAAKGFEEVQNWRAAAEAQHLIATVSDALSHTNERNAASAACVRLLHLVECS